MNIPDNILDRLRLLNLTTEEAKLYIALLKEPSTHLGLSKITGINRTKVYRLVQQLEKRSLVARHADDRGTFLTAADPSTLEVELVTKEETLKKQRAALTGLLPELATLKTRNRSNAFIIRTYGGESGLKQMCWHELKTKGDLVALGNGTIEEIVADRQWAERHRERQIEAGYVTREIVTYPPETLPTLTNTKLANSKLYDYRILSPDVLQFDSQTVVYNDTVAIYPWKHGQKAGIEIISKTYAEMFRQFFWHYWAIASPGRDTNN